MSPVFLSLVSTVDETWRPLGYEGNEAEYDALHDGIPRWMHASFWDWVQGAFTRQVRSTAPKRYAFDRPLLLKAQRVLRFHAGSGGGTISHCMNSLMMAAEKQDGLGLQLADFLLAEGKYGARLDEILHESGSRWKVGSRVSGKPGLVRRVPEGVQVYADNVMARSGLAGKRLAQAWECAFGIDPDPSKAYHLAIKAVEDAAIPVVVPKQAEPALGHVIGQLRNDGDWRLPLARELQEAPTSEIIIKLCQALARGQYDRHGGNSAPEVTQPEAEAAVTLAVTLVHWFQAGMVQRR